MAQPGNIPLVGQELFTPEWTITQFAIPAGAGATFSAATSGICTVTFNAAHGLTMTPTAGVMANYYITFGGSTSGLSGTGVLVGNTFKILSIPSTTAITIYSTITAATVTSLTGFPTFYPPFQQGPVAGPGSPTQTISGVVTNEPYPILGYGECIAVLGANCLFQYNPDQTAIPLDQYTTPASGTPATPPTWRTILAASGTGQIDGAYPWLQLLASGTTATSKISVHV
jgi:hypothetical protein